MREALYYDAAAPDEKNKSVHCRLCPHECKILPYKTGICSARKNIEGKLYSLTYAKASSINLDPIEKKPLYHFYPGSEILSVGAVGCTFRCLHCQNWQISMAKPEDSGMRNFTTEEALELARKYDSVGIAYTYNEPLINYEWLLETSKAFHNEGLKNALVTNGYINEKPLLELLQYTDAANIDVKSFREDFYAKICGAKLEPVLKTVKTMIKNKVHVELTYLIITNRNDSEQEISDFVDWVASIGDTVPLHFSRYFPTHKMAEPPTPLGKLEEAYKIAAKKLKYVYVGNVHEDKYSKTVCPHCGNMLVNRAGYKTEVTGVDENGACKKCGKKTGIIC